MSMDQLPIINIAAGAATSVIGSVAGYEKGQAEKAAADYNASMTIQTMQQEEAASEQKFGAIMGQQRAMYGAAGVDISQGSPLMVLADTAMQERTEQQRIQTAGTEKAALQRYQGAMAAYSADVGAMTTFLSGLGQTATSIYKYENQ